MLAAWRSIQAWAILALISSVFLHTRRLLHQCLLTKEVGGGLQVASGIRPASEIADYFLSLLVSVTFVGGLVFFPWYRSMSVLSADVDAIYDATFISLP
jgi:hypothetical protein